MTMYYSIGPPIRKPSLSEPQVLICCSNASPLSCIRFLIRRRVRIALLLHVYFELCIFLLTVAILKECPFFECAEVQGAGSRNEDYRQQPPATDYVTCRVVHFRCVYHTKEKKL